jgi:hypothetical protein
MQNCKRMGKGNGSRSGYVTIDRSLQSQNRLQKVANIPKKKRVEDRLSSKPPKDNQRNAKELGGFLEE